MIRVLCLRCAETYKVTSKVTLYKLLTERAKCEACGARDYCDEYEVQKEETRNE